jgi:sugar lactone lactonase YvrE
MILSACTSGTATGTPSTPLSPPARTTASPTPSPTPTPHSLATCPPSAPENALQVFARPGGSPDDLAPAADGGLWLTDQPNHRVIRLGPTGSTVFVMSDPRAPEGIVPQPDGTLILAEQGPDRVVIVRPPSISPVSIMVQLQPVNGRPGLDSIEADRAGDRLLIPDSPRGALRAMPLSGGPLTTLATGLGRPVDAIIGPDGSIYVTAENALGLSRVPAAGGPPVQVGNLVNLDDVLAAGPLLYVTDLSDGTLRAVDPLSGDSRTLVTGIAQPQGIAQLADGRLAVTDSSRGLVLALTGC